VRTANYVVRRRRESKNTTEKYRRGTDARAPHTYVQASIRTTRTVIIRAIRSTRVSVPRRFISDGSPYRPSGRADGARFHDPRKNVPFYADGGLVRTRPNKNESEIVSITREMNALIKYDTNG